MASSAQLSYQRLKHEIWFDEDNAGKKVIGRPSSSRLGRLPIGRELRVEIPSPKRFVRRKARVVKVAWNKMRRRLKECKSHFGDRFAGNYLFMQVSPTPLQYADNGGKSFVKGHDNHHALSSSRYYNPKIA